VTTRLEFILVRVCGWLFFGVIFAVLPVFMDVVAEVTRGGSAAWASAVDRGELLIAAGAISALSTADHIVRPLVGARLWPTLLVCAQSSFVICTTVWYAQIGGLLRDGLPYDETAVAGGSAMVFAIAIAMALCSIVWIAGREVRDA